MGMMSSAIVDRSLFHQYQRVLGLYVRVLDCNYIRGPTYLEVDVDIGSSTVANGVLGLVVTSLVVDMAFLVQANAKDELPERLIGAVRVSHIELSSAIVPVLDSESSDSLKT